MSFGDRFVRMLPSSTILSGIITSAAIAAPGLYLSSKGVPMEALADAYQQYMSNETILSLLKSVGSGGMMLATARAMAPARAPSASQAWDDDLSPSR